MGPVQIIIICIIKTLFSISSTYTYNNWSHSHYSLVCSHYGVGGAKYLYIYIFIYIPVMKKFKKCKKVGTEKK